MKFLTVLQLASPIWAAAIADSNPHTNPPIINSNSDVSSSPDAGARVTTENYAGSGLTVATTAPHFDFIETIFNVPTVSVPPGGKGTFSGAAWPGIQGKGGIAQAGAIWSVSDTTAATYNVWVEYYPTGLQVLPGLAIKAGDRLDVIISLATNGTQATVIFENLTTKKSLVHVINSPTPNTPLQANSANWVVEDYSSNGFVPFAHFSEVTFTNCIAEQRGNIVNYAGAGYPITMSQNGTTLATGNLVGGAQGENVTVVYGK